MDMLPFLATTVPAVGPLFPVEATLGFAGGVAPVSAVAPSGVPVVLRPLLVPLELEPEEAPDGCWVMAPPTAEDGLTLAEAWPPAGDID